MQIVSPSDIKEKQFAIIVHDICDVKCSTQAIDVIDGFRCGDHTDTFRVRVRAADNTVHLKLFSLNNIATTFLYKVELCVDVSVVHRLFEWNRSQSCSFNFPWSMLEALSVAGVEYFTVNVRNNIII